MNPFYWSLSLSDFLVLLLIIAISVVLVFRFIRNLAIGYSVISCILLLLLLFAFWTIRSYTFPSEEKETFENTDYHVFEHLGFEFDKTLKLVGDMNKEKDVLWDKKDGQLTLSNSTDQDFQLQAIDFYEPIYKNGHLHNIIVSGNFNTGIEILQADKPFIKLAIQSIDNEKVNYLFTYRNKLETDTCDFNIKLQQGYPLLDLLKKSNRFIREEDEALLVGSYLLRPTINGKPDYGKLYFFPSKEMIANESIILKSSDGQTYKVEDAKRNHNISINEKDQFKIGLGNSSSPSMQVRSTKNNKQQLRFVFSEKYQLRSDFPKDSLFSLFLTTSQKEVTQNTFKSGFFYPLFKNENNQNHISASLHYFKQSARDSLFLQVIDNNETFEDRTTIYNANREFKVNTKNNNNNLKWLFQLNNLRDSNVLKVNYLYYFVLFYLLMVLVTCRLVGIEENMTTSEFLSYIIIFGFLVVRIILQWRMSTFPPIEGISGTEYAFLRSIKHFGFTVFGAVLFFLIRIYFSNSLENFRNNISWWVSDSLELFRQKIDLSSRKGGRWLSETISEGHEVASVLGYLLLWGVYAVLISVGIFGLCELVGFSSERFINIALPIGLYLYFDYKIKRHREESDVDIIRIINTILTFIWLLFSDAGFSVIFILFLILSNAFIYSVRLFEEPENKIKSLSIFLSGFIFIFFILSYSATVFVNIYNFFVENPFTGQIVAVGIFSSLLGTILWKWKDDLDYIYEYKLHLKLAPSVFLLFAFFSYLSPNILGDRLNKFSYVKYRAEIHNSNLDDIIKNVHFDSGEAELALRAGQNQWFINNYIDHQKTKGNEKAFFNLQDHFNRGASYITQTTDLVVTRYIISEHSRWVVILLLALLLLLLTSYTLEFNIYRDTLTTTFKITVLLFTISYFIWLTATNRFIFFGQDFPLISLTSIFTVIFTLGLFLALIIGTEKTGLANELEANVFRKHIYPFIPVLAIIIIGFFLNRQNSILSDDTFNINQIMTEVKGDFNRLNRDFFDVQEKHKQQINKRGLEENEKIDVALKLLDQRIGEGEDIFGQVGPFSRSIFEHFKTSPNKRNLSDPVYLMVNTEGKFQFGLNSTYYLIQPPDYRQNKWLGDLLAAPTQQGMVFKKLSQANKSILISNHLDPSYEINPGARSYANIHLLVLPSSWYFDSTGLPKVILSVLGGDDLGSTASIRNSSRGTLFFNQKWDSPAISLLEEDLLSIKSKRTQDHFLYKSNPENYLMKNIWLNGKSQPFYPLEEDFLWAFHYSNTIERQYKNNKFTRTKSVPTGIDYDLTRTVRQIIKNRIKDDSQKEFGIVAVDGNGRIRVMTDYKPNLNINPNDINELNEFKKKMQLKRQVREERAYFGNLNLLRMKIGPGSSLKPLTYAAVTSQYPLPWQSLVQLKGSIQGSYTNPQNDNKLVYYAGQPIKGLDAQKRNKANLLNKQRGFEWGLTYTDYEQTNNQEYLIHSKNAYNSIINFLGSYNHNEIAKLNSTIIGKDNNSNIVIAYKSNDSHFPSISFGQEKKYTFNPKHFPKSSLNEGLYFGNPNSLLAKGFHNNFGLEIEKIGRVESDIYESIDNKNDSFFSNANYSYYSYPESSEYFQINRSSSHEDGHVNGIIQSSLGGYPIKVTPLKMAEMYGKLISFNPNYNITIDRLPVFEKQNFVQATEWKNDFFPFVQQNIYQPLEKVIAYGTGKNLLSYVNKRKKYYKEKRNRSFYYYAKTGTINSLDIENRPQDRMLMVTISDKDLTKTSQAVHSRVKFYTIYFTAYKHGQHDWKLIEELLEEIETSILFKQYFKLQ